jgi:hypothetical protein
MTLSPNINDLEKAKFVEDGSDVAVRVSGSNFSGSFITSGLKTGGKITEVTVNASTWTALPPTSLSGRNAISVQNTSGVEVKVNYDNTEPGYVGMVLPDGIERFYDISTVILYAKSSGADAVLNVEEIA